MYTRRRSTAGTFCAVSASLKASVKLNVRFIKPVMTMPATAQPNAGWCSTCAPSLCADAAICPATSVT